ncbi:MAG TPA: exosortase-associated EpsI family protein [Candidatus Sulfopaludibacter sp.]|nr:exosortase-associated EpsI family protein [Candidatus Sulfopaludibacter sp.]
MKQQKIIVFVVVLALIGGAAGVLTGLKKNQKLGLPGIKATPIPGSIKLDFDLPAQVLDFTSKKEAQDQTVLNTLPKDTSYAQRLYATTNGFWVNANIVLMGMDRTSIHKPEFCLPGQGWRIDQKATVNIPIPGSRPYQLRVAKWTITNFMQNANGQKEEVRGLYVFWFVARGEQTTSHWQRIWWLTRDLLTKGALQRWAYVSYFAICPPGQEEATFDQMKKLIAASVPQFQLPPDAK